MKLASEQATGFVTTTPASLAAVLRWLERVSLEPGFVGQRELALVRALQPYLEERGEAASIVLPLVQEAQLAKLNLYCDFYPEDGQFTLIEQVRDVVTEHIPGDERAWLDPLKHSYLDLLELTAIPIPGEPLALRSLGDDTAFAVSYDDCAKGFGVGQILLARVIRDPQASESRNGYFCGCGIALSSKDGKALYETARDWERNMEMSSGSLALGEWQEFTKSFGHVLLWSLAEIRVAALADAIVHIRYCTRDGAPYLYAVALYDHHDRRGFADGLSAMSELEEQPCHADGQESNTGVAPARTWIQRDANGNGTVVAQITLTSVQVIVECDGPERLDAVKHRLAASFGFALHFRDETVSPPARQLSVSILTSDAPMTVMVTPEEDHILLNRFLQKAYLEWSDQVHLALDGQTPRHAAASSTTRRLVGSLIDEMERHDPGLARTGKSAFSYNTLRAHVGLEER